MIISTASISGTFNKLLLMHGPRRQAALGQPSQGLGWLKVGSRTTTEQGAGIRYRMRTLHRASNAQRPTPGTLRAGTCQFMQHTPYHELLLHYSSSFHDIHVHQCGYVRTPSPRSSPAPFFVRQMLWPIGHL